MSARHAKNGSVEPVAADSAAEQLSRYGHEGSDYPSSAEVYAEISRRRRRGKIAKRIVAVVVAIVVLLGGAAGAYALWFTSQLDKSLAPDQETLDTLNGVLVPAEPGKPFYAVVIGSDSREDNPRLYDTYALGERSDVTMLVRIDPANKQVTMLSIPRDTPYRLEDGTYVKINEMLNTDGVAGTVKAVSDLCGVGISHYAEVHISGLEAIVDLLGGVQINVPVEVTHYTTDWQKITLEPGLQTLNGAQAQIFARARHEYKGNQEASRQGNVRILLQAIIKATLDRPITEIPGVVLQECEYIDTDMTSSDVLSLSASFFGGDMTMYMGTGPTEGAEDPYADGLWLCYEDPEGWKRVMETIDAGGDPDDVSYKGDTVNFAGSSDTFILGEEPASEQSAPAAQ